MPAIDPKMRPATGRRKGFLDIQTVRANAILTTAFVAGTVKECGYLNRIGLLVKFATHASGPSQMDLKVEWGFGANAAAAVFYEETTGVASGVWVLPETKLFLVSGAAAGTTYYKHFLLNVLGEYIKVSSCSRDATNHGTAEVKIALGNA